MFSDVIYRPLEVVEYSDARYMLIVRCSRLRSTKAVDLWQMNEMSLGRIKSDTIWTVFGPGYILNVPNDVIKEVSREIGVRCEYEVI